jgi:hypothetical protein
VDDWIPVEVAGSEAEAELLCSVLRGAGIECLPRLTNSGAGAGDGLGTVGAHDISQVARSGSRAGTPAPTIRSYQLSCLTRQLAQPAFFRVPLNV